MKEFFRKIQSFATFFLSALFLVVLTHRAFANEMNPHPENRIGYMDEAVVRSRVEQLGYDQPSNISLPVESSQSMRGAIPLLERFQLHDESIQVPLYELSTFKDGQSIQLRVNRLSGRIEEIQEDN